MPGIVPGTLVCTYSFTEYSPQPSEEETVISIFTEEIEDSTEKLSNLPQVIDSVRNEKDMICSLVPQSELLTAMLYGLATWYLLYKVTACTLTFFFLALSTQGVANKYG